VAIVSLEQLSERLAATVVNLKRRTRPKQWLGKSIVDLCGVGKSVMAAAEFRMMHMATALPRDPVRLYPILEMQSLGILIVTGMSSHVRRDQRARG